MPDVRIHIKRESTLKHIRYSTEARPSVRKNLTNSRVSVQAIAGTVNTSDITCRRKMRMSY